MVLYGSKGHISDQSDYFIIDNWILISGRQALSLALVNRSEKLYFFITFPGNDLNEVMADIAPLLF